LLDGDDFGFVIEHGAALVSDPIGGAIRRRSALRGVSTMVMRQKCRPSFREAKHLELMYLSLHGWPVDGS
jgi:hypothetical protein